jgi:hypothetical protein
MGKGSHWSRRTWALAAVVALGAIGASIAWAATNGGGVVSACVDKKEIRLVGDEPCKKKETALSFYSKQGADAAFLGATATAADSSRLGGLAPGAYLKTADTAADSNKLGGLAPAAYMKAGDTAADSDKLGGLAPGAYLKTADTAADSNKLGGAPASAYLKQSAPVLVGRIAEGQQSTPLDLGLATASYVCRTPTPDQPYGGSDYVHVAGAANQQLSVTGRDYTGIDTHIFISGGAASFIEPGTDLIYLELRNDGSRHATITVSHSHENGGCGFIIQSLTTG